MAYPAPLLRRRKRKCGRRGKATHAPWKKEIDECDWMRLENGRKRNGTKGGVVGEEVVDVAGVAVEVLRTIVEDAFETVAGVAGAEYVSSTLINDRTDKMFYSAPDPRHDQGPGHPDDGVLLLVILPSAQGVLGPAL